MGERGFNDDALEAIVNDLMSDKNVPSKTALDALIAGHSAVEEPDTTHIEKVKGYNPPDLGL